MIYTALLITAVILSIVIIILILLQQGKGADTGAIFGGGSSSIFGARGASTFLSKLTGFLVFLFFLNCLSLAYMAKTKTQDSSVLIDKEQKNETELNIDSTDEIINIPD